MKKLITKMRSDRPHWVGDGFPVRSIFSYQMHRDLVSPFLLLDYAGPTAFEATSRKRGVGAHPHRGFETVTIVYKGSVEHKDNHGGGGIIGPGDVQWMTAGKGIIHEEYHAPDYAKQGGEFEMIQLWVNLPKKHKMTDPRYQTLTKENIPVKMLSEGKAQLRVIAGEFDNHQGPAQVFSPMNLWDISVNEKTDIELNVPENHHASLFVLNGQIEIDGQILEAAEIGFLETAGKNIRFSASKDAKILFLGGQVIDEPIAGYGPFVMNTSSEIAQALKDYEMGNFF